MRETRRSYGFDDNDDQFDIGRSRDVEKYDYNHTRVSCSDSSDYSYDDFSPTTSKSPYDSQESMLLHPESKRRSARTVYPYRIPNKIIRWLCIILMSSIIVFILSLVRMSMLSAKHLEDVMRDKPVPPNPWEKFEFLKRYYGGVKTIVGKEKNVPEYPNGEVRNGTFEVWDLKDVPAYTILDPYPDYKSQRYRNEFGIVNECFLDIKEKIKVPKVESFSGLPKGLPDPVLGSHKDIGLSDENCFDRYGRYGPYGYGYSVNKGGIGAGLDGEREGAQNVWKTQKEIDYSKIRWADVQERCLVKNKHRFTDAKPVTREEWRDMPVERRSVDGEFSSSKSTTAEGRSGKTQTKKKTSRTAIILRTWSDFEYTAEIILSLRAIISELSLLTGGEYSIHFLIHVKDDNIPIWSDPSTYQRILHSSLPPEFQGMGTLWSERQMGLLYGGLPESFYLELPVHGVYRSAHMPLQYFAQKHPEFEYFWNWEMDVRYTGHYFSLLSTVRTWAKSQPRKGLWERNERFYIPSVHGSWDDFRHMVRVQSEMPSAPNTNKWANMGPDGQQLPPEVFDKPVWGPKPPPDIQSFESDPKPPTTYENDKYTWGVGEEADLITFNPIFNPDRTNWFHTHDTTGYNTSSPLPRRAVIITAARLSRRLLQTMHNETSLHKHSMFSEMFPASVSLHHGLKAVYVPHAVYIDRNWPLQYLSSIMNAGSNGAVGGSRSSVFGESSQHNLKGVTWHYNAGFAPNLYQRWWGKRVNGDGGEEEEVTGEGRMCLPGILLHPIKDVGLVVEGGEGVRDDGVDVA